MKTIRISDEMYNSLVELSTEMQSQDNLGTAMPHIFQIRTDKEVAAHDGCGEEIWVNSDGDGLRTDKDIEEFIIEDIVDNGDLFDLSELSDSKAKEQAENTVSNLSEWELETYLENHSDGWHRVSVTTEHEYQNTFLTSKACKKHIEENKHHYNNPIVYLNHAWRNPEQRLISDFLCGLTNLK